MTSDSLKAILSSCREMDILASKLYFKIAQKCNTHESKSFWEEMANEEREHIRFWESAIKFSNENTIPSIFENDQLVKDEIRNSINKANKLLEDLEQNNNLDSFFLTAYWMEFLLLFPSFNLIFHYIGLLSNGVNLENEYEKHLIRFVDGFKRFGKVSPEMELLGSLLSNLWKRNHELVKINIYDSLTKVFNRKGVNDLMIPYASLAQRNDYAIGVLMIDIDNFKMVNDTYGHQMGDNVLQELADRLTRNVRKADIVGRFGGEEFIIFTSNINTESIKTLAGKLNHTIADEPICNLNITISIGCCLEKIDENIQIDMFLKKIISKADAMLYKAKNNGKNRFEM